MSTNIYSLLNANFANWSIKNANIIDIPAESMIAMTVELTIENRTCVGASSVYKDLSKDVTAQLLEKAVYSAYNNIFSQQPAQPAQTTQQPAQTQPTQQPQNIQISKESLIRVNAFKTKYNITNDNVFNDYIVMWNKNADKKTLLTVPGALENFLDFIDKLESKQ